MNKFLCKFLDSVFLLLKKHIQINQISLNHKDISCLLNKTSGSTQFQNWFNGILMMSSRAECFLFFYCVTFFFPFHWFQYVCTELKLHILILSSKAESSPWERDDLFINFLKQEG